MLNKFAEDLKNFREKQGVSLLDIANETKLHSSIFEKLESGDFNFQPQTYIKAFLKQYAKIIKLDPVQVLKDYDLARAGKYIPKVVDKPVERQVQKQADKPVEEKPKEATKSFPEDPVTETIEEVFVEKEEITVKPISQTSESKAEYSGPKKIQVEKESFIEQPKEKKGDFLKSFNSSDNSYFKYIGIVLLILAIAAGIYFSIDLLLLDKGSNQEIVKQTNFDSIVKENEKNISSSPDQKRIDSIKNAKEKQIAGEVDSEYKLTMKIVAKDDGKITVIPDDQSTKDIKTREFKKGDEIEFKAKSKFMISTGNSNAFTLSVNEKKIRFDKREVRRAKLFLDKDNKVQIEE